MSKATKKSSTNKKEIVFEEALWDAANKLRGSVESAEYKHIVLSLIFLKFISDKFEAQREKLKAEGMGDYVDMVEFYTKDNVLDGVWISYDAQGNTTAVASYDKGVKVGTWMFYQGDSIKQVSYQNSDIAEVKTWTVTDTRVVSNRP